MKLTIAVVWIAIATNALADDCSGEKRYGFYSEKQLQSIAMFSFSGPSDNTASIWTTPNGATVLVTEVYPAPINTASAWPDKVSKGRVCHFVKVVP